GYAAQPGYPGQPGYPTTAAQPGSPGVPGGALPPGSGTGWPPVPPPQPPRRGRGRTIALVTVPALLVVAALVAVLVLKPWQTDHPEPPLGQHTTKPISYEAADNTGPAVRPAGAVHGGQLTVLTTSSFDHLDPAQVYFFDEEAFLQLVVRTLTAVRTNPDGTGTLVGDLATDPGTDVNGDCRTWRYTLRDGVQFADGTPITSHDVAYGIARSFDPDLISGFTTLQRWLAGDDYNAGYTGPGSGDRQPPGVHTPDERTIELTFPTPHCDLPYAASLPTTAPIPDGSQPSASTVDDKPPSSGPYQVSTHTGSTVTLTRNPHWVAATDPLRTADPDVIVLKLSQDGATMASKLIADGDADQASLAWSTTDTADARATGRTITGSLGYNLLLAINTKRVTSLDVRKGIAYAIDKNQLIGETVGTDRAEPATSVIPAGFAGYQQNPEAFPFDPARAKTLVNAPSSELKLTVVSSTNSERDRELTLLKNMLRPAGIYLTATQVDTTDLFSTVDDPADPYDMALVTWSPDWPSGYQQLRDMFGRQPI
ncbi:MAG TPA: ABC transporter substrate-binding protein, partial [Rugosimonospora sp.]|nr:ABC transporter substrate-binding protein [Rugosimonospora sp.]